MKTKTPLIAIAFASGFGLIFAMPLVVCGQTAAEIAAKAQPMAIGTESPNESAAKVSYQVLGQKRVNLGNRSYIYSIVAPPALPLRAPITPVQPQLTPEEEQAEFRMAQKEWKSFFFSAVIYDHRVTEITWGNKRQYRAYSSIDFSHFFSTSLIETDTIVYDLFFMSFNESTEYDEEAAKRLPKLPMIGRTYILDRTYPRPTAEDLAALNAIHAYYNAHGVELAKEYAQAVEQWRLQELWRKEHPPKPQDAVVNFWPIKSAVYLDAPKQGNVK